MVAWFAGLVTYLTGSWLPAGHVATSPGVSGLMALAAIALTGMVVAFLAHGARIAAAVTARPLVRAKPAQPGGITGLLLRVVPYVTLVIAAVMPLAAGLYLLTTTAWAAGERAILAPRIAPRRE
jgi:YidC/Oxa1 family membrane protein insertase